MTTVSIPSYEDKLEHVKLVADRGAQARQVAEDVGEKRLSSRRARAVYKAMGVEKPQAHAIPAQITVLADTPWDHSTGVTKAWGNHVRKVFVSSFVAGEPKPLPPSA
jgi:hypothetical protein